jgi:hypothetical protein
MAPSLPVTPVVDEVVPKSVASLPTVAWPRFPLLLNSHSPTKVAAGATEGHNINELRRSVFIID